VNLTNRLTSQRDSRCDTQDEQRTAQRSSTCSHPDRRDVRRRCAVQRLGKSRRTAGVQGLESRSSCLLPFVSRSRLFLLKCKSDNCVLLTLCYCPCSVYIYIYIYVYTVYIYIEYSFHTLLPPPPASLLVVIYRYSLVLLKCSRLRCSYSLLLIFSLLAVNIDDLVLISGQ